VLAATGPGHGKQRESDKQREMDSRRHEHRIQIFEPARAFISWCLRGHRLANYSSSQPLTQVHNTDSFEIGNECRQPAIVATSARLTSYE
jgi:hypothetical protein